MRARNLENIRERRFLLTFYGRGLTDWAGSGDIPAKEARFLTKRLTEEMERLAKARKGGKGGK